MLQGWVGGWSSGGGDGGVGVGGGRDGGREGGRCCRRQAAVEELKVAGTTGRQKRSW